MTFLPQALSSSDYFAARVMNATDVSPLAELLGQAIYQFEIIKPLLPTYGHLLVSTLFLIYIGAHASLARPSSAIKRPSCRLTRHEEEDSENEDEEDEQGQGLQKMEGLKPSDALLFPLMAGLTLGGLYLVIKWLEDPAILNKILSFYFSQMGVVFGVSFVKDALLICRSFIFPRRYVWRGRLWRAQQSRHRFIASPQDQGSPETSDSICESPLPGVFGRLPLPNSLVQGLWTCRSFAYQRVRVSVHVHGLLDVNFMSGLLDVLSGIVALSAIGFFAFVSKPWWLTNFLGFCYCYGALRLLSPSTFWTGSLLLGSLFLYDVYFVFFTPLMVTVATKLDVPIKLLFPRPSRPDEESDVVSLAMLGLGDIVVPGTMAALALRFDLYLFYKRKGDQKARVEGKEPGTVKPHYQSATGAWGERFWAPSIPRTEPELEPPYHNARSFSKPYFKASLIGYFFGMTATLFVMQYTDHAQPALLYLVPGVLMFLWGTALARGEIREMWEYSEEDMEEEEEKGKKGNEVEDNSDVKQDESAPETWWSIFSSIWSGTRQYFLTGKNNDQRSQERRPEKVQMEGDEDLKAGTSGEADGQHDIDLFSISMTLPRKGRDRISEVLFRRI